jgi:hypothetical protein
MSLSTCGKPLSLYMPAKPPAFCKCREKTGFAVWRERLGSRFGQPQSRLPYKIERERKKRFCPLCQCGEKERENRFCCVETLEREGWRFCLIK